MDVGNKADVNAGGGATSGDSTSAPSSSSSFVKPQNEHPVYVDTFNGWSDPVQIPPGEPHRFIIKRASTPKVLRIRLIGMFFDHAKSFMLSNAIEGIRKINDVYKAHPNANLLLVGHTDTKHREDSADAGVSFNKKLSFDRAKAIGAYLTDDVNAWYDWYNVEGERRWGTPEDVHMLSSVPHGGTPYLSDGDNASDAMKRYQADQGLPTNIGIGERTRRALIRDYMNADGTTLPKDTKLTAHGCGPFFPDVATGPNDDIPQNRRVEMFVFDGPITPPPPGEYSEPGSPEYPAWLAQVGETIDFSAGGSSTVRFSTRLLDRDRHSDLYSGKPYEVVAMGQTYKGISNDSGVVECMIPAETTSLVIRMAIGLLEDGTDNKKEWALSVVPSVPPVETLRGMLMRLHNLGYYEPMEGSTLDDNARFAIRWFQSNNGLTENGNPDDVPTQQKLVVVHDA